VFNIFCFIQDMPGIFWDYYMDEIQIRLVNALHKTDIQIILKNNFVFRFQPEKLIWNYFVKSPKLMFSNNARWKIQFAILIYT